MARWPYHIARQEHLGDALDDLQARGGLQWQWDYAGSRAIFRIRTKSDDNAIDYDTRSAERIVQARYDDLGVVWKPVAHPGGETQRAETLAWIRANTGS